MFQVVVNMELVCFQTSVNVRMAILVMTAVISPVPRDVSVVPVLVPTTVPVILDSLAKTAPYVCIYNTHI